MNERIKELSLQAGLQPFEDCGPGYVYKMEKFAELVWTDGYKEGMNMMIRAQLDNPIFSKAMDEHYESKWAHRFD